MDLTKIVQDAKVGQTAGKNGAVVIQVQNIGDKAINKSAANDGDIMASMEYILERLPEPKIAHLHALAAVVAYQKIGTKGQAAKYLGVGRDIFTRRGNHNFSEIVGSTIDNGEEFPLLPESPD